MIKDLKEKLNILRGRAANNDATDIDSGSADQTDVDAKNAADIARIKKVVRRQGLLAIGTLVVVGILLFAMTSAWYTNVSKTSALTFKSMVWGFDTDKITVSDRHIPVAPGKSGVVPLEVDNSGERDSVEIHVTMSKTPMNDDALRRRIYFYADYSTRLNDELVSRVYLGSTDDDYFSYVLLPGQKLMMSDEYYNDTPIKWEWVYDVEGYYFRGTVNANGAVLDEYVRPIQYDLDRATFDLTGANATGRPVTIDGASLDQFLNNLTTTDGYAGDIDTTDAVVVNGTVYYPIDVSANGNGVWAYLCTYGEIEREIAYDTEFSSLEEKLIGATVTISAVNIPSRTEAVGTAEELWTALSDPTVDVVELNNDVAITSAVSLRDDVCATIDLNGFAIEYAGTGTSYAAIIVRDGAELTVMNGDIVGNGGSSGVGGRVSSIGIEAIDAEVTLSNVRMRDLDTAVYVADVSGTGDDSVIRIYGCDLETFSPTVYFMGNGVASDAPSQLIIENSTLTSTAYAALTGQGSTNRWGTEITILDSTLTGYFTAIYQPQQRSSTLICRSELTGITGIAVKGGTVNITDSTVTGTGPHANAAASGSGWADTGDGIYVEAVYDWNVSVSVNGESTVTSQHSYATELFGKAGAGEGKIILNDGSYAGALGAVNWNSIGIFQIYGGNFNGSVIPADVTRFDVD